ncbi:HAD-IA family hydrolase [Aliiglaciecola sp. CAU 1673]|uniref:HAD family hydrolase n=1 Tax=Aliiglaciecola sp. CAU 1673 TaxID=3032595 RepID=UPI0023DBAC7D|nr:HAD-IA family hydrolase [Aliiglaciecola sp. CAU 1673]MDF2177137.1 HAD-IA family hydrolase [Aliiglaciecola sp. CAU 1673]
MRLTQKSFRGIIFDLDDTLITSPLNFPRLKAEIGAPEHSYVLEHIASQPEERQAGLMAIVERHELYAAHQAILLPGVQTTLGALQSKNIPMAILTRNRRQTTDIIMQRLSIPISLVLTREDCAPKPAPDGLLHISKRWKIPAEELVFVGDHAIDMQAAANAGMPSCLVAARDDGGLPTGLRIKQLDELLVWFDGY